MINIAIDGPAGAGKSTIAKAVASKLGYIYVDTGALYRSVAYYVISNKIDIDNKSDIIACLKDITIKLLHNELGQRVIVNEKDVSDEIRTPEISNNASKVSAIPEVRQFLFDLQKDIANNNNIIMDGRDIGTVVLPNADVKIFLTASAEERANRRFKELIDKGVQCDYDQILQDIITRDYNDSHREIAPLKQADDAILIDTSDINLEQSIEKLYNTIIERIK